MKSDGLIAESLVSILKAVNEEAVPKQWSTKKWTDTIKLKVSNLGQEMNLYTCCSYVESANRGEWLYDLCWLEYDNEGYLVQSKLIMEREWSKSNDQIIWEFQKLLLGKADIKVMVWLCP